MITRKQLREIHNNDLPLHILEQDYVQSLFLYELYVGVDGLVFKGGTFLKHAHGLDRFSEGLDFTMYRDGEMEKILAGPASRMGSYGVDSSLDRIEQDSLSFNARLRYRGPLYDGSERSIGFIDIEISRRKDVFLDPEWTRLFFNYPETRVVNVLGLRKEEVFAEKLRALSTRCKGRDLYDVWFLLKQKVKTDVKLFERKMKVTNQKPDIHIDVSEKRWNADLRVLLVNPPEYNIVMEDVIKTLMDRGYDIR